MLRKFLKYLIVLLAIHFFSCNWGKQEPEVLKFWAMGDEGENVKGLIEEFEHLNPDVKVKVQQIPWTAAHEKLLTAFAGNSLPDVFQLGNTWIPEFVALNALEPLNGYLDSSLNEEHFFSRVLETNIIDSKLYGIPWYVDTRVLFYRKDFLSSVGFPTGPRTLDELLKACERIRNKFPEGKVYPIFLPTNEWQSLVILALQTGAEFIVDNFTIANFSSEKFRQAFNFLREFYFNGYAPSSSAEIHNIYQAFAEGYILMYITGPWNIGEFRKRLPPEVQDKWMTAPIPGISEGKPGYSLAGGSSLVINSKSAKKNSAWRLIKFLSQPSTQLKFYRLTGNLPSVKSAWEDETLKNDPHMRAFFTQLYYLKAVPKIPEWEQIALKLMEYIELSAFKREISSDSLLASLDRDINKILEKRRWLVTRAKSE